MIRAEATRKLERVHPASPRRVGAPNQSRATTWLEHPSQLCRRLSPSTPIAAPAGRINTFHVEQLRSVQAEQHTDQLNNEPSRPKVAHPWKPEPRRTIATGYDGEGRLRRGSKLREIEPQASRREGLRTATRRCHRREQVSRETSIRRGIREHMAGCSLTSGHSEPRMSRDNTAKLIELDSAGLDASAAQLRESTSSHNQACVTRSGGRACAMSLDSRACRS